MRMDRYRAWIPKCYIKCRRKQILSINYKIIQVFLYLRGRWVKHLAIFHRGKIPYSVSTAIVDDHLFPLNPRTVKIMRLPHARIIDAANITPMLKPRQKTTSTENSLILTKIYLAGSCR